MRTQNQWGLGFTVMGTHGPPKVYLAVLTKHGFEGLFLSVLPVLSCLGPHRLNKLACLCGNQRAIDYLNTFRVGVIAFLMSSLFLGRAHSNLYFLSVIFFMVLLTDVCLDHRAELSVLEDDQYAKNDRSLDFPILVEAGI